MFLLIELLWRETEEEGDIYPATVDVSGCGRQFLGDFSLLQ